MRELRRDDDSSEAVRILADREGSGTMYLPRSLLVFLLSPALMALQVLPFTGVFLMMLLAPFLHVAIINGGMILLALEAVAVKRHIRLIIPCLGSVDMKSLLGAVIWRSAHFVTLSPAKITASRFVSTKYVTR